MSAAPVWLLDLTSPPEHAAVAVPGGSHVGVLFRDRAGALRWLHLAFHHRLTHEDPPEGLRHVASTLDPERLALVAAMCERVVRRQGRNLPYGFRYDATRFAQDGALRLGPEERGLTCATFVLAIYRSVGVEVLKLPEWPERPDDVTRFEALLQLLAAHGAERAHVSAVKQETGARRYRPAEVAGGSSCAPPCGFADAERAAAELLAAL
jgi:hypothetical protein